MGCSRGKGPSEDDGGGVGFNASYFLTLGDCNFAAGVSPPTVAIYSYPNPNEAYSAAGFNFDSKFDDTWVVNDLSIDGEFLDSSETITLNSEMMCIGATRYKG
jgi:hypothetical protein